MTDDKFDALKVHARVHEVENKMDARDNSPLILELTAAEGSLVLGATVASLHAASISLGALAESLKKDNGENRDPRYLDDILGGLKHIDNMLDIVEAAADGTPRTSLSDDDCEDSMKAFRRSSAASMAVVVGIPYDEFSADVESAEMNSEADKLASETGKLVVPGNTSVN